MRSLTRTTAGKFNLVFLRVAPPFEVGLRAASTAAFTPEAGKFYNITLNKDKGYTDDGQGNYTVTSAEGLKNIAKLVNEQWNLGINITLTADIDLSGTNWTPIGIDYNHQYAGTFDGGDHTITGLTVTGSDNYAGLFGNLSGTVKDVTLKDVQIARDYQNAYVGGVAGYSEGNIENCSVSGSVSGTGTGTGSIYVGGVTGLGSLTACYHATGDVTGASGSTGGVVGRNFKDSMFGGGIITACYWNGTVTGDNGIGNDMVGNGKATKVADDWTDAVTQMNTALQSASSEWRYELTGELPTLTEN